MLLEGKKALIFGVANAKSIAYGIAAAFRRRGARLAFNYVGEAIRKRVDPIAEELDGEFTFQCDVTDDAQIAEAAALTRERWGGADILVHSLAFAGKEELTGRFIDTSRSGFLQALDISAYSLTALCRAFEDLLVPGSSVITMTYYGSQKVITNYNVMGVAKAALEASVRYLAMDLGKKRIRINAISAGPVKTLAASGISDFRKIFDHIEKHAPLGRNITTDEVGGAAAFLASDLASGVTGATLFVDSGYNILGITRDNGESG
jgi:enoyl-[acyl-carrier protein] reductase I